MKRLPSTQSIDAEGQQGVIAPKRAVVQDGAHKPDGSTSPSTGTFPVVVGTASSPLSASSSPSQPPPRAQPQLIRCGDSAKEVWPQHWGITIAQCKELIEECVQDPEWRRTNTVYTLVEDFVKPRTRGTGLGYALLRNQDAPLEVSIMVSHTWAENAEDFFRTLERSVEPDDVMFICALSLCQNEDGAGPTIAEQLGTTPAESPFGRVLNHILHRGSEAGWIWRWRPVLRFVPQICLTISLFLYFTAMGAAKCVPTFTDHCAVGSLADPLVVAHQYIGNICVFPHWEWHWVPMGNAYQVMQFTTLALFLLSVILFLTRDRWMGSFRGRMVIVPNSQCDLYSRLWCVYEVFVAASHGVPMEMARTLAPAGKCRAIEAVCSNMADTARIRFEIEAWRHSMRGRGSGSTTSLTMASAVSGFQRVTERLSFRSLGSKKTPEGPRDKAYMTVDGVIRLVTLRAHRSAACVLLSWVAPFSVLAMALPKGDYLTREQFFGTMVCTGIYSVILVWVLLVVATFSLARNAGGSPSLRSMLTTAGILVSLGVVFRIYDRICGPMDSPPMHHCFTFNLVSAGMSLGLLSLAAKFMGIGFVQFRWRAPFMALLAAAVLVAQVLTRVTEFSAGQILPMVIWYTSFRVMPLVGYPTFMWLAAARWGVVLGDAGGAPRHEVSPGHCGFGMGP